LRLEVGGLRLKTSSFPSVGVGDGSRAADGGTGWRFRPIAGFAGGAMIADLLPFLMLYKSYGFFSTNVDFIRPHFKDF
jgi:hypothetical protein